MKSHSVSMETTKSYIGFYHYPFKEVNTLNAFHKKHHYTMLDHISILFYAKELGAFLAHQNYIEDDVKSPDLQQINAKSGINMNFLKLYYLWKDDRPT